MKYFLGFICRIYLRDFFLHMLAEFAKVSPAEINLVGFNPALINILKVYFQSEPRCINLSLKL